MPYKRHEIDNHRISNASCQLVNGSANIPFSIYSENQGGIETVQKLKFRRNERILARGEASGK